MFSRASRGFVSPGGERGPCCDCFHPVRVPEPSWGPRGAPGARRGGWGGPGAEGPGEARPKVCVVLGGPLGRRVSGSPGCGALLLPPSPCGACSHRRGGDALSNARRCWLLFPCASQTPFCQHLTVEMQKAGLFSEIYSNLSPARRRGGGGGRAQTPFCCNSTRPLCGFVASSFRLVYVYRHF